MKSLLNFFFLVCILGGISYVILRLPVLNETRACYEQMEKVNIKRINNRSNAYTQCNYQKQELSKALECFEDIDGEYEQKNLAEFEIKQIKQWAMKLANADKDIGEVVERHRDQCPSFRHKLSFDMETLEWF